MFPEIHEIVNDEPTKNEETKIKLSIPNVNTIFSELFAGGDELLDEALKRFGHLNTSNCAF